MVNLDIDLDAFVREIENEIDEYMEKLLAIAVRKGVISSHQRQQIIKLTIREWDNHERRRTKVRHPANGRGNRIPWPGSTHRDLRLGDRIPQALVEELYPSMTTNHVVIIWHNIQEDDGKPCNGYAPGHAMTPVFVYVDSRNAPEYAVLLGNMPPRQLAGRDREIAARYRANQLRPISIGDVIQIDDRFYSIDPVGFTRLGSENMLGQIITKLNVQPPWAE